MGKIDLMNFPDDLLCSQILTRLPLKEVVRFSAVSRKWCRAWTRLPHLKFSDEFFDSICTYPTMNRLTWLPHLKYISHEFFNSIFTTPTMNSLTRQIKPEDIINKIILLKCGGLETFELCNCDGFESSIDKWLLWISLSGVKCIDLKNRDNPMEVSESIFSCVTLKSVSLDYFMVRKVPAQFKGFPQLVTCYLKFVSLSQEAFEAILKLCRLLQSLTLSHCGFPSNLRIISSSLKSLALLRPYGEEICPMEANCPRLESIKIIECHSLVMGSICLPVCVHLETDFQHLKHFVMVESLKKITCFDKVDFSHAQLLLLQSFPRLEELCIESPLFVSYPEDAAELSLRLPKLKTFTVNIGLRGGDYENYVAVLCAILKGAPLLKAVEIVDGGGLDGFDGALQIVNDLAERFPETKISLSKRRIVNPGGR